MTALGRFLTMPCCGCAMTTVCGRAVAAVGSRFVLGTLFQHSVSIDRGFCKKPAEPQSEANGCDDDHDQCGHRQDQGDEL